MCYERLRAEASQPIAQKRVLCAPALLSAHLPCVFYYCRTYYITKLCAWGEEESMKKGHGFVQTTDLCVFITAGPSTKLFACTRFF